MFNPNASAHDYARLETESARAPHATPIAIVIVTDDHATAQALVSACELMPSFDCRVRVAALRDDPAGLRALPDEVLIVDVANALERRLDPARYPASPCVSLVHATTSAEVDHAARSHAAILFENLSPAALELAVRAALQNCRALTIARRTLEAAERSAIAARDNHRRMVEEVGPIAHALEGLLDIMGAENAANGELTPTQFGLLHNWTRDLLRLVARHQDASAAPVGTQADFGAIVENCVALFRSKSDGLGHIVVVSSPQEPLVVAVDPRRLHAAIRQLTESALDRELRDRRIDIVLWRSMDECRLAIVSGPPVRRGAEADEEPAPTPVRPAGPADERFAGALAQLRQLGAVVETNCANGSGSSLLVSLPIA
ncbi:MAG: hypothetical protein KDJ23_13460 [Rhodoblastus sp.]|nr:hypothetical protein [Rhodoblastus sp.]